MSVAKIVYLICDECAEAQQTEGLRTVREAREDARIQGWKRRHGRDLCGNCADAEIRKLAQ